MVATFAAVEAALRTDQGRVRDHNEDFIASWEPNDPSEEAEHGWLYIVADGVGGAEAGEVASQFACEQTIRHYLAGSAESSRGLRLQKAMQQANSELRQMVAEQKINGRMATTMVAAVLHDGGLVTLANVGDSRAYLLRDGQLRQLTKDQSLVARLVEEGAITEEEALTHPRRNVILHSLGAESSPQIDLVELELDTGDQLILCSDGLTRHVSDAEIGEIVQGHDVAAAAEQLIDLANARGGEDNISAAILRLAVAGNRPKLQTRARGSAHGGIAHDGRAQLWLYTAALSLLQTIAIVTLWFVLRV
jgi:PPM family protein phosphatase